VQVVKNGRWVSNTDEVDHGLDVPETNQAHKQPFKNKEGMKTTSVI